MEEENMVSTLDFGEKDWKREKWWSVKRWKDANLNQCMLERDQKTRILWWGSVTITCLGSELWRILCDWLKHDIDMYNWDFCKDKFSFSFSLTLFLGLMPRNFLFSKRGWEGVEFFLFFISFSVVLFFL